MNVKHYFLQKDAKEMKKTSLQHKKLKGLSIKPLNKMKYDGIKVKKLIILDKKFINKLLKRKVKRKLEMYLNYLITYIEDGGEDGTTDLRHALNDLTRYKEILNTKYQKFLEDKYIELLFKKIAVLQEELKIKIIYAEMYSVKQDIYENEYQETRGKSR